MPQVWTGLSQECLETTGRERRDDPTPGSLPTMTMDKFAAVA